MLQAYESIIMLYIIILYKIIKVIPDLFWSSVRNLRFNVARKSSECYILWWRSLLYALPYVAYDLNIHKSKFVHNNLGRNDQYRHRVR